MTGLIALSLPFTFLLQVMDQILDFFEEKDGMIADLVREVGKVMTFPSWGVVNQGGFLESI